MEKRIKLLYAEDSADWANMIGQLLTPNGFSVRVAKDGDDALQLFRADLPDMVLLDIDLPGRNGWELIREFKQEKEWIPVVLYSSFFDSKRISEAFGLGAEDFLSKTCPPEELTDRLLAFYERAKARKEKAEIIKISRYTAFNPVTGLLCCGDHREVLKHNESCLLYLLCLRMNKESDKKYLCEGIWGKGMYNDTKCKALKIYVTNLRKYLAFDPLIRITNRRWGGYCLIDNQDRVD